MAGWICDGISKDNDPHPEQHNPGKHESYENFGKDCVVCGLSRDSIKGGTKFPIGTIAAGATAVLILGSAGFLYTIFKPCSSGQQKINGSCVASRPMPSPTVPLASPTASTSALPSSAAIVPSASTLPIYQTLTEVLNVPQMKVRYGGSTSFAALRSPAIINRIRQAHPGFVLVYTEPPSGSPGSGSGIDMLLEGQLSVAQSSRGLKEEDYEKAKVRGIKLDQQPVAIDGIALYVNPQVTIPGLTLAQIKDIYTGKITNWSELGSSNLTIRPFSRNPKDGGTPEYFQDKILEKESFALSVQPYARDTTTTQRELAQTPGGIGYATASEVCNQSQVRPLPIAKDAGFVEPCVGSKVNQAAFANDSYPITRRLFVIIRRDGTLDEQAGVAYTNLLLSDEGQQIVDQAGLVRIR